MLQVLVDYPAADSASIVRVFIDATFVAVDRGRVLVEKLTDVRSAYHRERLTARRDSVAWQIVDALIGQRFSTMPISLGNSV